ncbi:hypothetical protein HGRIS_010731 [Hohenbuehelia grisea]|uniref:FAD-binding domain-containing protein n=1 Tax=Hohenbuehelia grisea TaxID=104357 RepID=A0ABR3IXY9_9AGAR
MHPMQEGSSRKIKVAIIGGGIGGLTCVLALKHCEYLEIDLYEAAPVLSELGAGIAIWERAWEILQRLNLAEAFEALLSKPRDNEPALAFVERKGDQSDGFDFFHVVIKGGPITYHRADFQRTLLAAIPAEMRARFHLSQRLVSYKEREVSAPSPSELSDDSPLHPVELLFADGTKASCDVLIGADGVKSAVRRQMMTDVARHVRDGSWNSLQNNNTGEPLRIEEEAAEYERCIEPMFSGWIAYRGLVPTSVLRALMPEHRAILAPTHYWGKDKHLVAYPISQGKTVNIVAYVSRRDQEGMPFEGPWVTDCPRAELESEYARWEDEVRVLIQHIEKPPTRWAIHSVRPLKTYISRHVVLLGDAAHAMTPHQGAAAGQAIEDGYVLASLLSSGSCTPGTIPTLMRAYDTVRRPFGNAVQAACRRQGMHYDMNWPGAQEDPAWPHSFDDIKAEGDESVTRERLQGVMEDVVRGWEWEWTTSAEVERRKALEILNSTLSVGTN